ncbi:MAG: ABC transporter permease [Ruminiclostridium sp.]
MKKENNQSVEKEEKLALDDERRVKVLSPTMLVMKRFFRNKLAIAGLIIIVAMFLFSFVGGFFAPYGESQVFTGYEEVMKEYANATVNNSFRYSYAENVDLSAAAKGKITSAVTKGLDTAEVNGTLYTITNVSDSMKLISIQNNCARVTALKGIYSFAYEEGAALSESSENLIIEAIKSEEASVEIDGLSYLITRDGKYYNVAIAQDIAIASKMVYNMYNSADKASFDFKREAETALANGEKTFTADGVEYALENVEGENVVTLNGQPYANITNLIVQPVSNDIFLTVDYKLAVQEAIDEGKKEFTLTDAEGNDVTYEISGVNGDYKIKAATRTQLIKIYEEPSSEHWLGTDANGMDIFTRLMYGGRISLMIGFVVVIIEIVLGVILGGIAGYFGGWVDNLIMRIVDIFNCIPSLPLYIIIGSIMDAMKIEPTVRIYYLMLILGLLSWPGIARLVRGQILSLREQEFMTAAEATGISVSRRIFRHLIPNVIPQLIVMATMGLGSIIITESTLSFLGLGVKYPYASWGNIVNAVTNLRVMTNYWFVWIPAGFLILITVLGFNFIGDGLRDAFDPKMKR